MAAIFPVRAEIPSARREKPKPEREREVGFYLLFAFYGVWAACDGGLNCEAQQVCDNGLVGPIWR